MEQAMQIDAIEKSNLQNDDLSTPYQTQKRLLVPPNSSSKRSLFQEAKETKQDSESVSDVESDLGPMSPLALTENSSCDSSPGRQFISPLATPEKSPIIPLSNWNGLIPGSADSGQTMSPFSSLRQVTRSARYFPRQIFAFSPKSKSAQSSQNTEAESNITSQDDAEKTLMPEEVIPDTPGKDSDFDDQQSYVAETPQKEEYPENRLITPLGSVYNGIPIPRIHRRKSFSTLESNGCTSPEMKKSSFKRHMEDSLMQPKIKCQKLDEFSLAPKARAALFQENKHTPEKEKTFTLNPKSFYGSKEKLNMSFGHESKEEKPEVKKRRSFPSYSYSNKRSTKKHRKGEINCGVGHGIKRPKPKRQSLQNSTKIEKQTSNTKKTESKENMNPQKEVKNNQNETKSLEVDANKKFFKFKPNQSAIFTVNDQIKLKVALNQKDGEHAKKKAKLDQIPFDATDLTVDEPDIETSIDKSNVDNILKILEDDWADDDYEDAMETAHAISKTNLLSPKKSNVMLKSVIMSPGSELSSMASTMNIQDSTASESDEGISLENQENNENGVEISTKKFYPLFSKGYVPDINDENNSRKRKRTTAWQLSSKYGNADNQYQIDAGQKLFGASQCNECGIIYHIGDPDDENAHLNYHNSFKKLKFQGWKNERVVCNDYSTMSRIILVEPKDSNTYWKKVTDVLEIVDRDLGLSDMKLSYYRDKKVYIYIRDKTILGVLVAEYVKQAFQMIPEISELNCCTSETTPVKCGVNVVWTAMSHRRQGIATKLVDTLRSNYYFGYIMSIDDIAFSTPTPSGKQFAQKYTKTQNFKVY